MNKPLLDVCHLRYGYDEDVKVLKDVSFSVYPGQYVSIIGHNGSGKSTLAKCIMGLLGGFDGDIEAFGIPLNRKNLASIRPRIGIVFQNPDNQFVGSTVEDDIAFGLENRQVPHEQMQPLIEKVAQEVGMQDFLDHEPQMLSGGQKQRVAIAGVLAMHPDLVIFDEATAMLDPKGKREIHELISKMREENPSLTLLSITHDIEEAFHSDEVIVLDEGEIRLQGKPDEVFSHIDELRSMKLGVPFFFEVKDALEKAGLAIPENIKTTQELEEYLCR